MYERKTDRLISRARFARRVLLHALLVVLMMYLSILAGVVGFMWLDGRSFEDALLHSAYIISGFGLVEIPDSLAGKLFAGLYGLYANLFVVAAFSVVFAPVVHRILHRLHLVDEAGGS